MSKILIVLPFSGRTFGGGLAVFNEELTKALATTGHDVVLLTMDLPHGLNPDMALHGNASVITIRNDVVSGMSKDVGGPKGEQERNKLYSLFNQPDVLLQPSTLEQFGSWVPDLIIGHSRFSGPAAIMLRDQWFPNAKAEYFLHSIPVEGKVLVGYDAYLEDIDADVAERKFAQEKEWMPRADVVVAVGPLIRAGATMILEEAGSSVRVHECIGGTTVSDHLVSYAEPASAVKPPTTLLFIGRASAPIKGFEDIILAALLLRKMNLHIKVRYWDTREYKSKTDQSQSQDVQENTVTIVDLAYVNEFVHGAFGPVQDGDAIRFDVLGKLNSKQELEEEIRSSHAVLMPSYIEHFGLVPFDGLALGVPVLINEISGAAMFLGDEGRFGKFGQPSIVHDFDPDVARPLKPVDFLGDVASTAFDTRPQAWADAIHRFIEEIPLRFDYAHNLSQQLKRYTWSDCGQAAVDTALNSTCEQYPVTVQGPGGRVYAANDSGISSKIDY